VTTEAEPTVELQSSETTSDPLRSLRLFALGFFIYLVAIGAGSSVGALLLLDSTTSDDLGNVALLALLGGALGATVRTIWAGAELLSGGWELPDGTIIRAEDRRAARARAEAREELGSDAIPTELELAINEKIQEGRRFRSREAPRTDADQEWRQALLAVLEDRETEARRTYVFGLPTVTPLLVAPLVGAALGPVAFAGAVGGFIIASGGNNADYSPTGILFIAVLAGMFAENFIAGLARGADAIFGTTGSQDAKRRDQ